MRPDASLAAMDEPPAQAVVAPIEDLEDSFHTAKARAIARFERVYLAALMRRCGGNVSRAARTAGLSRGRLRTLLRKSGLYERCSVPPPPESGPLRRDTSAGSDCA